MKKIDSKYILVVGCGRFGSHVAGQLSRRGHSVVVIDTNPKKFAHLDVEFSGFRVEGDATEIAVLRQAKADKADSLIVVTADDNVNVAVAQVGKRLFAIKEVFARVVDPERSAVAEQLGVQAVCPLTLAAADLLGRVLGARSKGAEA
jgi:trk system potassium uptake protein TrkA